MGIGRDWGHDGSTEHQGNPIVNDGAPLPADVNLERWMRFVDGRSSGRRIVVIKGRERSGVRNARQSVSLHVGLTDDSLLEGFGVVFLAWKAAPGRPIVMAEGGCSDVLGRSRDELFSLGLDAIVDPADRQRLEGVFEEISSDSSKRRRVQPFRVLGVRREPIWVEGIVRGGALTHEGYRQCEALLWDGTASAEREQHSLHLLEAYRTATEVATLSVWETSPEGMTRWLDPVLRQRLGYDESDAIEGAAWIERIHPDDRDRVLTMSSQLRAGTIDRLDLELRLQAHDGTYRWVHITATRKQGPDGRPGGLIGTARDITEHRRILEREQRQVRLDSLARMAVGIAHEFNNLLTVMQSNVDFLLEKIGDDQELRGDLEDTRSAIVRASQITSHLLLFGSRQSVHLEDIDFNQFARQVARTMMPSLPSHVSLDVSFDPFVGTVRVDAALLQDAITSLIQNAAEAIEDAGTVVLRTTTTPPSSMPEFADLEDGEYAYLCVEDNGRGMDPVVVERATEPYYSTKRQDGAGLGLSTVASFVRHSGGKLAIESKPGVGTRVCMALPMMEPVREHRKETRSSVPERPGKLVNIMVVDDQPVVRDVTRRMLERSGYRVHMAASADEALQMLRSRVQVDLLVTDVVMPRVNGIKFVHEARTYLPGLPVVFMSASGELQESMKALDDTWFLAKPFHIDDITGLVEQVLARTGKHSSSSDR